jgi:hypothetical protein
MNNFQEFYTTVEPGNKEDEKNAASKDVQATIMESLGIVTDEEIIDFIEKNGEKIREEINKNKNFVDELKVNRIATIEAIKKAILQ